MPYLKIQNVDHYYEWICQANESTPGRNKPVMVFLHGWCGSTQYWQNTARELVRDFDCLLYDLKGFGRSRLPANSANFSYDLSTYVEDLAELLNQLNLSQIYLNGHSMGASISLLFANRYPTQVKQLILTCSGVFTYDETAFSAFYKFASWIINFRPPWLLWIPFLDQIFMARFLHRPLPLAISRAFLEDFVKADYDAALGTIFTSVSQEMAQKMPLEFTKIAVPTLLISGEYDQIIPPSLAQKAREYNQKIRGEMILNTAHFPMLEDPRNYLKCLHNFLQDF